MEQRRTWTGHRLTGRLHGPVSQCTAFAQGAQSRGVRFRRACVRQGAAGNARANQKEHLSKLARGDEQRRIPECEVLPEIGSVLLADLKPSQVSGRTHAQEGAARGGYRHFRAARRDQARPQYESAGPGCCRSDRGIPTTPQGKRSRALSDPEISHLLRWLDSGAVSRTIVDVLRLTLCTGARSGEVCAMRSRDVDIDAKTSTHTQGKTGDVSVTPLSAPAVEILRNRLGEAYVFPVRGNPVDQMALSVALFA